MMIVNILQYVSGIQRKQVNELEVYKGISIVSLKESPEVLALQVKDKIYVGIGYYTLECAKEQIDKLDCTIEQMIEREFNTSVARNSPRISLGAAQYFNRVSEHTAVQQFNEQKKLKEQQEREQQERLKQQQREQQEYERLQKSATAFKSGNRIPSSDFIGLCKLYSIKLPLKTHGWVNAALCNISVSQIGERLLCDFQYYKGHKSSGVIDNYAIELYKKITA